MLLRCRAILSLTPTFPSTTVAAFSTRRTVDVILMKDAKHVGYQFDQVAVAPGHARNFLIPQRIAVYATEANKLVQQQRLQGEAAAAIEKRRAADAVLKVSVASAVSTCGSVVPLTRQQRLSSVSLVFDRAAAAGDDGRLFGSVSAEEISAAIKQKSGIDVPSTDIGITGSIKSLGQFQVPVRTADRLSCTIKVEVRQQAKAATSAAAAASAAAASESKAPAAATATPPASPAATTPAPAAANAASSAATGTARKKTDKQLQGTKHAAAKKDADGSKA